MRTHQLLSVQFVVYKQLSSSSPSSSSAATIRDTSYMQPVQYWICYKKSTHLFFSNLAFAEIYVDSHKLVHFRIWLHIYLHVSATCTAYFSTYKKQILQLFVHILHQNETSYLWKCVLWTVPLSSNLLQHIVSIGAKNFCVSSCYPSIKILHP